jgi:hypothetical protein
MTNALGKFLTNLTLLGQFQVQVANVGTNIDGDIAQLLSTEHSLLRGVYLGFKADSGNGWTGNLSYDLANASFDPEGDHFWADDNSGMTAARNGCPSAHWTQPARRVCDWEAVVRYSCVDGNGHGASISNDTRFAPSGGTMSRMSAWSIGGNWYVKSNDATLHLGCIHSKSEDTGTSGSTSAKADGDRGQT